MCKRLRHLGRYVQAILLSLSLFMSACSGRMEEVQDPSEAQDHFADVSKMVVYKTDTTEWLVYIECTGVLYNSGYAVDSPYHIPTREEAATLKTCTYPSDERFVTCDGYTFGMPSSSVTKAGSKTKYSVLGLCIRRSAIIIEF